MVNGAIDVVDMDLLCCRLLVSAHDSIRIKSGHNTLIIRGFTIAGNFLPKFLADRGAAANESVYDTYRN